MFAKKNLPPVFEQALEFTAFGLDQFKAYAERDGVSLPILAVHLMGRGGNPPLFERMNAMAKARGFPWSTSTTTLFNRAGVSRTRASPTTFTGTPPAINGRRKPCSST